MMNRVEMNEEMLEKVNGGFKIPSKSEALTFTAKKGLKNTRSRRR